MLDQPRNDWQFGFWSALCLEMIIRASLASVSTTLLADAKDWKNILFALGKQSAGAKLSAKSIDISEAVARAESLFPEFNREMANFSVVHLQRRNAELHSGSLPFDDLGTSWLPQYYACCATLLQVVSVPTSQIFGDEEASTATTLIQALSDDAAKAVKGTINAHKTLWEDKDAEEQKKLSKQAETLSSRAEGHRVTCPACSSVGLVQGTSAGQEVTNFEDGMIVVRQPMLPSHFECKACNLKISGFSKLNACGLGGTFTSTVTYDPTEYFEDDFRDNWAGYDEDNNEP
ncbi:hypothetical protein DBB29_12400 [Pandoraea cepalis]|uniref:Uncharacterized protein n=1 Tax=Pandoraea cepalis TaxID=2508294 RepID=A0AAW7ML04_9BURK|nr:hypothetical protein [Pandoraea cepalis]MDN4573379.1 hypothetical protein [Pandoraea cepalis]MDN4578916.1 hypothetical protein [Pandoraea cepalis]